MSELPEIPEQIVPALTLDDLYAEYAPVRSGRPYEGKEAELRVIAGADSEALHSAVVLAQCAISEAVTARPDELQVATAASTGRKETRYARPRWRTDPQSMTRRIKLRGDADLLENMDWRDLTHMDFAEWAAQEGTEYYDGQVPADLKEGPNKHYYLSDTVTADVKRLSRIVELLNRRAGKVDKLAPPPPLVDNRRERIKATIHDLTWHRRVKKSLVSGAFAGATFAGAMSGLLCNIPAHSYTASTAGQASSVSATSNTEGSAEHIINVDRDVIRLGTVGLVGGGLVSLIVGDLTGDEAARRNAKKLAIRQVSQLPAIDA